MFDPQDWIDGIDKTTIDGFAEALMIAMLSLKNQNGLLIAVRMSDDPHENIRLARDVARMMLHKAKSDESDRPTA